MKKTKIMIIITIVSLFLISCKDIGKKPDMYIEKAELSREEEDILELFEPNVVQSIYDFKLDDSVKSMVIKTYELIDGKWELVAGESGEFTDVKGRIGLNFERLAQGLKIGIKSKKSSAITEFSKDLSEDIEELSYGTSLLNNLTEIIYEGEIPLVIQVLTKKDLLVTNYIESFLTPEKYEEEDYVYAVTVKFSEKTVGELDMEK